LFAMGGFGAAATCSSIRWAIFPEWTMFLTNKRGAVRKLVGN
jgi:hypothetical protein